ncbi:MAG TPA: ion channel [Desulfatiglandales bacterium]|nr:ion channel [Desulfatiglandales bacterium]
MEELTNQIIKTYRSLKRRNIFTILGISTAIICFGAIGLYTLDGYYRAKGASGMLDTLWWALVTITTVGYGDVVPHSTLGRLIGIVIMFSGVVLVSLFTATIASVFVERKIKEGEGLESIKEKNHIVICGWNNNGEKVIEGILIRDKNGIYPIVLINELDKDEIESIQYKHKDRGIHFVRGSFVKEDVLARANIFKAKAAIILSDISSHTHSLEKSDERTIFGAMAIKSMAPKVRICAELVNQENKEYLLRANVDDIIIRGESHGSLLAGASIAPGFLSMVKTLVNNEDENKLWDIDIPSRYTGKPCKELSQYFKERWQGLLIALLRERRGIQLEDILSGNATVIDAFIKRKFEESRKDFFGKSAKTDVIINPPDDLLIEANDRAVLIAKHNSGDISFFDKFVGPK